MTNIRELWDFPAARPIDQINGALQYRSIAELNRLIVNNLDRFAHYDVIVGIPRSGMLVASLIALNLNIPLFTLTEFLCSLPTRRWSSRFYARSEHVADKFLVVDDSVNSGAAMKTARKAICESQGVKKIVSFVAVYATKLGSLHVDYFLEQIEHPRVFEWNVLHHGYSPSYLVDLDGIMCRDGPPENSNDGGKYLRYIEDAPLKIRPTGEIGAIVTSRLVKYRASTESWLKKNGIKYRQLIMLDLDSAEQRRALAVHARYKADVYSALGGMLFIESEEWQAKEIARITKRPVFCLANGLLYTG